MKITIDAHKALLSKARGAANYTTHLIQALLKRNSFEYELAFFDKNRELGHRQIIKDIFNIKDNALAECNEIKYADLNKGVTFKTFAELCKTTGDILHFPIDLHVPCFPGGKSIITAHDLGGIMNYPGVSEYYTPKEAYGWSSKLNMALRPDTQAIIADSEFTKQCFQEYFPYLSDKIYVAHLGFDCEQYKKEINNEVFKKYSIGERYFFYLGILCTRKNIFRILDAFEIIAEKYKDVQFVFSGDMRAHMRHEEWIMRLLTSKFRDRIIVTGRITDDEARTLYSGATGFVFPSLHEGFGIPILEAQACGCPVITSNNTACPEVAGKSALLINPHDTEEISDAMEQLLNNSNLRANLTNCGYENIKRFSWDKCAEETEKVYEIF